MIDPEKTNLGVPNLFIQGDGVIELSEVVESRGLVGRDREGIRIIRANVGLACRESLCKEDLCLGGMSQRAICAAQSNLQIGDDERVADDVTFEVSGCAVQSVAKDCAKRPAFLLLGAGIEVSEDRREDIDPFLDLF